MTGSGYLLLSGEKGQVIPIKIYTNDRHHLMVINEKSQNTKSLRTRKCIRNLAMLQYLWQGRV